VGCVAMGKARAYLSCQWAALTDTRLASAKAAVSREVRELSLAVSEASWQHWALAVSLRPSEPPACRSLPVEESESDGHC
jgi:hypothetical protein